MTQLHWIHEPARKPVDEEGQIYEEVIGKAKGFLVAIYLGAEVDPEATERDGRPRYRNVPMVCVRVVGEKDFISEPLTDEHAQRFPRAMAWWEKHKDDPPKTPIALLPGVTPADLEELEALGLTDAETLAEAEVPKSLQRFRDMARRLRSLAKPRLRIVDGELVAA